LVLTCICPSNDLAGNNLDSSTIIPAPVGFFNCNYPIPPQPGSPYLEHYCRYRQVDGVLVRDLANGDCQLSATCFA
jgi:hypothetical protein